MEVMEVEQAGMEMLRLRRCGEGTTVSAGLPFKGQTDWNGLGEF